MHYTLDEIAYMSVGWGHSYETVGKFPEHSWTAKHTHGRKVQNNINNNEKVGM